MSLNFFDPRTWVPDTHEHRIYLTPDLELYAIVDACDYAAAVAYTWSSLGTKWKRSHKPKHYARRNIHVQHAPEGAPYIHHHTGKLTRNRHRTVRSVFLHHFIAERMGLKQPTPKHKLDHKNGNSLDCRRQNLRWVTPAFNTSNVHGALEHVDVAAWEAARMVTDRGEDNDSGRDHQGDPDANGSGAAADRGSNQRKPRNRGRAPQGRAGAE